MPANSSSGPLGDLGDTIMSWLLLLGGAAAVLAVGYIAYGLFAHYQRGVRHAQMRALRRKVVKMKQESSE